MAANKRVNTRFMEIAVLTLDTRYAVGGGFVAATMVLTLLGGPWFHQGRSKGRTYETPQFPDIRSRRSSRRDRRLLRARPAAHGRGQAGLQVEAGTAPCGHPARSHNRREAAISQAARREPHLRLSAAA